MALMIYGFWKKKKKNFWLVIYVIRPVIEIFFMLEQEFKLLEIYYAFIYIYRWEENPVNFINYLMVY